MAGQMITVGSAQVYALLDAYLINDGPGFWAKVPLDAREKYPEIFTPGSRLRHDVTLYLVVSQGRRMIVDTGVGANFPQYFQGQRGRLLEELRSVGVSPTDIDYVFCTHLHGDHIGWNFTVSREMKVAPTFPRARYFLPKADWEFFRDPSRWERYSYVKELVLPLEQMMGQIELVQGEHRISAELSAYPTPGHTPGHQSLLLSSGGQRALFLGDAAHERAQVQETDWQPRADSHPDQGVQTRRRLMEWLAREELTVCAVHYPYPGFGKVVVGEGRRYWQPWQPG